MIPAVSVVVATRNRSARLGELLRALEAQTFTGAFEVVIVDDASTDGTRASLERLSRTSPLHVSVHHLAKQGGAAAARNAGWRAARAPLVAFTDDDCIPQPGWLEALVAQLSSVDLVQGRTVPDPAGLGRSGPFARTVRSETEGQYPTCNMGYRRVVLERVGGFDEEFPACEDTDLALRAKASGATSGFAADALVHHAVHPSDFGAHLREKARWAGVVRLARRHPEARSDPQLQYSRHLWRRSHGAALWAAAGITLAAVGCPGRRTRLVVGAAALMPYYRFRTRHDPLPCGPRRNLALMPVVLATDLWEVGVLARAALRYRVLVL